MFKLLICGHNGFVGNFLFNYFENDYEVFGADLGINNNINEFKIDFTQIHQVKVLINSIKPDYIINLIGLNKGSDLNKFIEINVNCISNIFQSIVDLNINIKKIIHTSSSAVYGTKNIAVDEYSSTNPINYYGFSKLLSEQVCIFFKEKYKINTVIVRPSNIIGENLPDSFVLPKLIKNIYNAKSQNFENLDLGNLEIRRDFISVNDVAEAYKLIFDDNNSDYLFNISQGKSISLLECVETVFKYINYHPVLNNNNSESEQMDLVCKNLKLYELGFVTKQNINDCIIKMADKIKEEYYA